MWWKSAALLLGLASSLPSQVSQSFTSIPGEVCGLQNVVAVAPGGIGGLALQSDGTVWEWYGPSAPVRVAELSDVVAVAAGIDHHMALKSDGTVWEWSGPWIAPMAEPSDHKRIPFQVEINDIVSIAAGETRSLAVKRDGTVWEWTSPIMDDFLGLSPGTPKQVDGLSEVVVVSVAYEAWWDTLLESRTVALKQDGTVWVWYAGEWSRFNSSPAQISELSGIVAIAAGTAGDVALKDDGTVWQWDVSLRPVQVNGLTGITAVAVGSDGGHVAPGVGAYGLALHTDGTVWTWGNIQNRQWGDGTTPVQVRGLTEVKALAAAGVYAYTSGIRPVSVAIKHDGTVWSWGETWNAALCRQPESPPVSLPTPSDSASDEAQAEFEKTELSDSQVPPF